jgi:fructose-1,6-bisphosphatase/inositol monophosphatase family enzyme
MAAAEAVRPFTPGDVAFERKEERGDPVTAADHAADLVLREILPQPEEGWLSEESVDDPVRLGRERVWVVDPIDGTREFVEGIPEWCISIGLLEGGVPVAGGIYNPATGELVLGSVETGVTYNGHPAQVTEPANGEPVTVLASRSEIKREGRDSGRGARHPAAPDDAGDEQAPAAGLRPPHDLLRGRPDPAVGGCGLSTTSWSSRAGTAPATSSASCATGRSSG